MAEQNSCNDCKHNKVCELYKSLFCIQSPKCDWFVDFEELKNEIYEAVGKECKHFMNGN